MPLKHSTKIPIEQRTDVPLIRKRSFGADHILKGVLRPMSKMGPQFYVMEQNSECLTAGCGIQPTSSPQSASSKAFLELCLFLTPCLSASHKGAKGEGCSMERGGPGNSILAKSGFSVKSAAVSTHSSPYGLLHHPDLSRKGSGGKKIKE